MDSLKKLEPNQKAINSLLWVFAGVLIGFVLSKYSAMAAYDLGYSVATKNIDQIYETRMAQFKEERKQSCLAWWFNDSANNIRAAQFYMCQNRERWQ